MPTQVLIQLEFIVSNLEILVRILCTTRWAVNNNGHAVYLRICSHRFLAAIHRRRRKKTESLVCSEKEARQNNFSESLHKSGQTTSNSSRKHGRANSGNSPAYDLNGSPFCSIISNLAASSTKCKMDQNGLIHHDAETMRRLVPD